MIQSKSLIKLVKKYVYLTDEMVLDFQSCLASIHDGTITVLIVKPKTNIMYYTLFATIL